MSIFNSFNISASGMTAERLRSDTISQNLANANTTNSTSGGAYKRKTVVFEEKPTEQIHYALTKGTWTTDEAVLVRVQSSGTYFDVFSRLSNGEHPLMQKVTDLINAEGKGAVVFINNVSNKENTLSRIQHFLNFQDGTNDQPTIAPNFRDYGIGTQILKDLGINKWSEASY